MTSYLDIQFYGQFYVGSQQQSFNLIIDTGSSWLWVPSTGCESSCVNAVNFYNTSESTDYT